LSIARGIKLIEETKRRLSDASGGLAVGPGKAEFFREEKVEKEVRVAGETRMWVLLQMKKLVEIGMRKIAAKSTGKSEKIRWANALAHIAEVVRDTVEDVELDVIYEKLEETKEDLKKRKSNEPFVAP